MRLLHCFKCCPLLPLIAEVEPMNEKLLTVEQAAEVLSLNPQTVRRWLRTSKMRGLRTGQGKGSVWRVPESAITEALTPNTPSAA